MLLTQEFARFVFCEQKKQMKNEKKEVLFSAIDIDKMC